MNILDKLSEQFETVKQKLNKQLSHQFLLEHIQKPVIDNNKLQLLLAMMDESDIEKPLIEKYAVTSMLISIALDTHELVSNETYSEDNYDQLKERQLTVLGGIYYSSLYYKILAEIENIQLTKIFAIAIKEINENKVFLYRCNAATTEELFSTVSKIETALFEGLYSYIDKTYLSGPVTNFLMANRLHLEKENILQNKTTPFLRSLQQLTYNNSSSNISELSESEKEKLVVICNEYLEKKVNNIKQYIEEQPTLTDVLRSLLTNMISKCEYK